MAYKLDFAGIVQNNVTRPGNINQIKAVIKYNILTHRMLQNLFEVFHVFQV